MTGNSEKVFPEARWYAISARSRQEKVSAAMLDALGVVNFLPMSSEVRQWSDRKQLVHFPLFPGYLFVKLNPSSESVLPVLKVPGVVGFVRNQDGPLPIPEQQIEDIRRVLQQGVQVAPHAFLKTGDRVRIVRGALAGLEGTLIRANSETRLVISIDMIQRSIAVTVARQDLELLGGDSGRSITLAEPRGMVVPGMA
jgi:transcription elongation factor/antiterminator RfaH